MPIPEELPEQVADLYDQLAEFKRREEASNYFGTIAETDFSGDIPRYRVRIEGDEEAYQYGDDPDQGESFLSPWITAEEVGAGKNKTHVPFSVGEQVRVSSQSGELIDGVISSSAAYDKQPLPSTKEDEVVIMNRNGATVKIIEDGKQIVFDVDGTSIIMKKEGITVKAPDIEFEKN